ncbi:MAG: polyprenyl synthetase family protein [Acidobacteriota bacterium]|nr:polyprenyl synthetase family protein [Acidobacteriota bacterium]
MTALSEYLREQQRRIEREIDRLVPPEDAEPRTMHRAMRYSLMAGGKRIRPILCLEAVRAVGGDADGALPAACSLEFIHTYSLIHDDLPSLDNDDFRRGKPTCHKVFGEAMAILAGDSLLTLAFQVLAELQCDSAERQVRMIVELARASGTVGGMIGGQVADIEGEGQRPEPALLDSIHRAKTGALLCASVRMGAIFGGASEEQIRRLTEYGEHAGLAFQVVDDILDVEESSEALGKTAGKDADQGKITFPAVYGLERSREMAREECAGAYEAVAGFGERAARLREIADMIVSRKA